MSHGRFHNPVQATLTGIKDIFGAQPLSEQLTDALRFDGKKVLVTGASNGLGFAVAVDLAKRGAHVIMACRSGVPEKGDAVKALSGSDTVEILKVDLSDLKQVHSFADTLKQRGDVLDVVIENAGVATPSARQTTQGLDQMFATNFVAKFVLLRRLLQDGTLPNHSYAHNGRATPARIIFISSDSHRGASAIDWDEFGRFIPYGVNKGINHYSYFKLVMNTFASELARRLTDNGRIDVATQVMCPGPVDSNILRDAPWALKGVLTLIFKLFFRSPEVAARPVVYMAGAPEYGSATNQYLHMFIPKRMDEKCYGAEEGAKLWQRTDALLKSLNLSL